MRTYKGRQIEIRTFPLRLDDVNEDAGIVTGYASIFNELIPQYNEIVMPGAFKKTLQDKGGKVPIFADHDIYNRIGIGINANEDERGLYVEGEINLEVQAGRERFALIKQSHSYGVPYGISIGFRTIVEKMKKGIRELHELALMEWSPVSFPAAPNAGTIGTRNDINALDILCDKCRAAIGLCDEPPNMHSIAEQLRSINESFKKGG